jgi:hypothetical protein
MADLTPKQKAEVERLVAQGVPREQAIEMATEVQLDVVIGGSGASDPRVPALLPDE